VEELTDQQLTQLRDALRAYYRDHRDSLAWDATWVDVFVEVHAAAEENGITLDVGLFNGPERLRQFVEGKLEKDGTRTFQVPQPSFLAAVHALVTACDLLPKDQERRGT